MARLLARHQGHLAVRCRRGRRRSRRHRARQGRGPPPGAPADIAGLCHSSPWRARLLAVHRHLILVPVRSGRSPYRADPDRVRLHPHRSPVHRVLRPAHSADSGLAHPPVPRDQPAHSAVWGLAFLAGTISLLIAGSVGDRQVLLRVIVPFGALYLAYRYTQKQTRQAQDATPPGEPAASGPACPPRHAPRTKQSQTPAS